MRHAIWGLLFAVLLGSPVAQAQDRIWRPYIEMEARGDTPWAGQGNMFLPLLQDGDSMIFADARGLWTDLGAGQGSYGLAYRQMLICDTIFGVHGAYDHRHTEAGNNFSQGVLGLEMLGIWWGARANGYLADDDAKKMDGANIATLIGNNIFLQQAEERAYSGADFEFEVLLLSNHQDAILPMFEFHAFELWAAAGAFHYEADSSSFEDISGPRARIELRLFDIPFAGPDSRLVFGGQFEHDDVRGGVGSATANIRIPFGRGGGWEYGPLRGLNRRMVAPIERTNDVITQTRFAAAESVAFARSGQAISQVLTVDANTVSPETVISSAGNDSLIIVDGAAGTINPGGTINTQTGQVLLAGGSSIVVTGVDSGASATFTASGQRPTIDSGLNTTVSTGTGSSLIDLSLANTGDNIRGIFINNAVDVLVDGVDISTTGNTAPAIELAGASNAVANSTSINTSGDFSDGVTISGTSGLTLVGASVGTSGDNAEGIDASGASQLLVLSSSIFTSGTTGSEGVIATDSAQLTMVGSLVAATGTNTPGLLARPTLGTDTLSLLLDSNSFNATSHAISLDGTIGTLDARVNRNILTSLAGSNELDAVSNGGTINLSAAINDFTPFIGTINLNEIGGAINVSQDAPFTGANGIDAVNGLPATNVLIPGNTIDFNQPVPPSPTLP